MTALPLQSATATRTARLRTGILDVTLHHGADRFDDLIGLAARANSKRGFLFVSRVLGKHWPARPSAMLAAQARLARGVPATDGPVVFIALAETAIGLGQGMFEAWLRTHPGSEALFLHTTRYRIGNGPLIEFEEEHSHAPRQYLHMPTESRLRGLLLSAKTLVLVDDEATTGNTFLNLTAACRRLSTSIGRLHLSVLANFMGTAASANLSQRFGLPVSIDALVSGECHFTPAGDQRPSEPAQILSVGASGTVSGCFGRLGLDRGLATPDQLADRLAARIGSGQRVLVLGTGEFMHPVALLAAALEHRGIDVVVQSTTRSPVLLGDAVSTALRFQDPHGEPIRNHLYNVVPGQYDHVIVCHEIVPSAGLVDFATWLKARLIHFRSEDDIAELS